MSDKQDKPNPYMQQYVKDDEKQTMLAFVTDCLAAYKKKYGKDATHIECSVSDWPLVLVDRTVKCRKYVRPGNVYLWREEPKQVEK